MKIELQNSYFNEETGESIAIYNTDLGSIVGKAKLHPEEKYPSKYFGQEIARRRGIIRYCQKAIKKEKAYLKSIINFQHKIICQSPKEILGSSSATYILEKMKKERSLYKKNIDFYQNVKNENYKKIDQLTEERENTLNKFYEKKAEQNG